MRQYFWVIMVLLFSVLLYFSLNSSSIKTNLFALLPDDNIDNVPQHAVDAYSEKLSRKVIFLFSANNDDEAIKLAELNIPLLEKSRLFSGIKAKVSDHELAAFYESFEPYRFSLLSERDRAGLNKASSHWLSRKLTNLLVSPVSGLDSNSLTNDPFLLYRDYLTELPSGNPKAQMVNGYTLFHENNRSHVFVHAELLKGAFVQSVQDRFSQLSTSLVDNKQPGQSITLFGVVRYAYENRVLAENEMSTIGVGSLIGIIVIFFLVFRRLLLLPVILLPIAVGGLAAFSISLFIFGELHLISLIFGASLIGVSIDGGSNSIIPWYHEDYILKKNSDSPYHRTKTLFDKSLVIRTNNDIEILRQEAEKNQSSVRRIRIQPEEECLLRNKNTLRDIGKLSKKIDAVILLEGGILSHAYYQLNQTGANVEVVHPFRKNDDKREFNKLVRDNVPSNIERGGEAIETAKLSGEFLLTALKEKLIEEAFEVLDSVDQDSMIDELADVNEVINGILSHLGANRNELLKKQREKRKKSGGFNDGIVLLETRNPPPSQKGSGSDKTLFNSPNNQKRTPINGRKIIELGHKIDQWTDRKIHTAETEELMRLVIPMVCDNWASVVGSSSENSVPAKIKGTRLGSKLQIELSIFVQPKPLQLFGPENSLEDDNNGTGEGRQII